MYEKGAIEGDYAQKLDVPHYKKLFQTIWKKL